MQRNRLLGMLPGLLFGAASIAKEQGLFETPGLTPQELAGNNAVWARLGQRPQMEAEGPQMADMPQPTPGLSLAGAAHNRVTAIPIDIGAPQQAPQPQFQPQQSPMSAEDSRSAFFRSQGVGVPQQPAAPPGLLSDQPSLASLSPDEQSRRRFFQSQGIGPAMNVAMR